MHKPCRHDARGRAMKPQTGFHCRRTAAQGGGRALRATPSTGGSGAEWQRTRYTTMTGRKHSDFEVI
ncbi:hypothetical protein GN956_G22861 [Arapaima gigas]